jgi:hypothetical protein
MRLVELVLRVLLAIVFVVELVLLAVLAIVLVVGVVDSSVEADRCAVGDYRCHLLRGEEP